jgi:hypothetical protein
MNVATNVATYDSSLGRGEATPSGGNQGIQIIKVLNVIFLHRINLGRAGLRAENRFRDRKIRCERLHNLLVDYFSKRVPRGSVPGT